MSLRKLLNKKKLDENKPKLDALLKVLEEKREAHSGIVTRGTELMEEIEKANMDDFTEEERDAINEETERLVEQEEALKEEISELEEEKQELESLIRELEEDLDEEDPEAAVKEIEAEESQVEERNDKTMNKKLNIKPDAIRQMVQQPEVRTFLQNFRDFAYSRRTVQNADLLIPEVMIGVINENIHKFSKLSKHVLHETQTGTGRTTVVGEYPEAVWTEKCANLNELMMELRSFVMDGWKVGGFVAICKAVFEDADSMLLSVIMEGLGQSIGKALDKAIVYGDGIRMPLGIIPRLAKASAPADWPATAPAWKDLTSHIKKITGTEAKTKAKNMLKATGPLRPADSGGMFWAMNQQTYTDIMADMITFDSGGYVVARLNGQMPILGGAIEILPFMADGDIVGGFGHGYKVLDRKAIAFDTNDRLRWIEEQLLFKAVARMDGMPVIPDAFIAFNYNNKDVKTEIEFAPDKANAEEANTEEEEAPVEP